MNRRVILASASPRRRELLARIGIAFEVLVSESEELTAEKEPSKVVVALAREKARAAARLAEAAGGGAGEEFSPTLVLGADTIVVLDGQILGKPKDAGEARRMLRGLSGRPHHVLTGVCGVYLPEGREETFFEDTEVVVDELSDAEIEAYVASGEPFDKAGGYGIQGGFSKHVRGITGDYFNVVGLPLHHMYKTFFS